MGTNEHPTNIHARSVHIRVSLLARAYHVTFVHTSTAMSQSTSQKTSQSRLGLRAEPEVQQGPGRRPTRLSDRKFSRGDAIRTGAGYFIAT